MKKNIQGEDENRRSRGILSRLLGNFIAAAKDRINYIIVFLLIVILGLWLQGSNKTPPLEQVSERTNSNVKSVLVQQFTHQPTERIIRITGQTKEERMVNIKAEISSRVESIKVKESTKVNGKTSLMQLEQDRTAARLNQASAQEQQARIELESEKKLHAQGLSSAAAEARTVANHEAAKAALVLAREEHQATSVFAPFEGYVEKFYVEEGDFVQPGQFLASVVDYDPMLVVGSLSELEVAYVTQGIQATVSLFTGEVLAGTVRLVATQADEASRTFDVEIEIPHENSSLRSGVTAEVEFHAGTITASQILPAILSLNERGELGVKTVDRTNSQVVFTPVKIVKAETNNMWVTGLAADAQVITRGFGFVRLGEQVNIETSQGI